MNCAKQASAALVDFNKIQHEKQGGFLISTLTSLLHEHQAPPLSAHASLFTNPHLHFVMMINSTKITINTTIVVMLQLSLAFRATFPNRPLARSSCP